MIRLRCTPDDHLTTGRSRMPRHTTTVTGTPTAGIEKTDVAGVNSAEAPNPQPTGGR
jgi:hypothetical protein